MAGIGEAGKVVGAELAGYHRVGELRLANLQPRCLSALREGVNPAWQSAVEDLREWAVKPLFRRIRME